jgi:hypothetical protein
MTVVGPSCYDISAKHLLSQEEIYFTVCFIKIDVKKQYHEICVFFFFIKQFLLVTPDMPRQDSNFCRILVALFVFVIDYPVYCRPKLR